MGDGGSFETVTSKVNRRAKGSPMPGVIVITAAGEPTNQVVAWCGKPLSFGRDGGEHATADAEMSSEHALITHLGDSRWRISDRATKNGTYVNGSLLRAGSVTVDGEHIVVRMGRSFLLLDSDIERYSFARFDFDGTRVTGPAMGLQHSLLAAAARDGVTVLVQGETGTGKEYAAEVYHRSSRNARGPLVRVNCSTITKGLAEAQLFGAKKGAASGVEAQSGYIVAADRGTLFLDEIGDLDREIQAKLLRVLEDKLVWPLGENAPRKVDFQLVSATHKDLRQAVERGTFREDLLMRIAQDTVYLPPLRERREEIPYLVAIALAGRKVRPAACFLQECLLRPWKANVRDLMSAVQSAARSAERVRADEVYASDLPRWTQPGASSAPVVMEEMLEDEAQTIVPDDSRWPELKRLYEQHRDAKKACDLAGVPRSTGHRWLHRAGLIAK